MQADTLRRICRTKMGANVASKQLFTRNAKNRDSSLCFQTCNRASTVGNKADLLDTVPQGEKNVLWVSARTGLHLQELKEQAAALAMQREPAHPLVADLLSEGDTVVLVVPIDKAAPKGRLILPQQQTIRDILEAGASALVCRDTELAAVLDQMPAPPRLVITDSQVFACVNKVVPPSVPVSPP